MRPSAGRRALLAALQLTSSDAIAARCGVGAHAVRRWADGSRVPSAAGRRALETFFAIPLSAWPETSTSKGTEPMPDLSHRSRADLTYAIEHSPALRFARGRPWLVTGPVSKLRDVVARAASKPGASIVFPPVRASTSAPAAPPPPRATPRAELPPPARKAPSMPKRPDPHLAAVTAEITTFHQTRGRMPTEHEALEIAKAELAAPGARARQRDLIGRAMGVVRSPGGVRDEGTRQIFEPSGR